MNNYFSVLLRRGFKLRGNQSVSKKNIVFLPLPLNVPVYYNLKKTQRIAFSM